MATTSILIRDDDGNEMEIRPNDNSKDNLDIFIESAGAVAKCTISKATLAQLLMMTEQWS